MSPESFVSGNDWLAQQLSDPETRQRVDEIRAEMDHTFTTMNVPEQLRRHQDEVEEVIREAAEQGLVIRRAWRHFRMDIETARKVCVICNAPFLLVTPKNNVAGIVCCSGLHEDELYAWRKEQEQNAALSDYEQREAERRRICPRPDKQAWHTMEVAEQVRSFMRQRSPETSQTLEIYPCKCGSLHLGRPKVT